MHKLIIPRKLIQDDDLVVIPRHEYETLIGKKLVKEFTPTAFEKKAVSRARKNFRTGKYVTLDKLRHELGFTRCRDKLVL